VLSVDEGGGGELRIYTSPVLRTAKERTFECRAKALRAESSVKKANEERNAQDFFSCLKKESF